MTSGFVHRAHTLIRALALIMLAVLVLAGCEAPVTTTVPTPAGPAGGTPPTPPGPAPTGPPAPTYSEGDESSLGILRSTDRGATWTSLGRARIRDLGSIEPADCTPLVIDGRIVLYFIDLENLDQPVPQTIYSATSADGVNFEAPRPAYTQLETMMDPFVLRMGDRLFRLYVPSEPVNTMLTAVSTDGFTFTREGVASLGKYFGMPGALLLPDDRVRIFLNDGPNIVSMISDDGLSFTAERGVRIPNPDGYRGVGDPEPIRLRDGSYLMYYQAIVPDPEEGREWVQELHLATSQDGFDWTPDPAVIGHGGTSCVVEAPDGTLFIYYGN